MTKPTNKLPQPKPAWNKPQLERLGRIGDVAGGASGTGQGGNSPFS